MSAALALYLRLERQYHAARRVSDASGAVDAMRAMEAAKACLSEDEVKVLEARRRPEGGTQ